MKKILLSGILACFLLSNANAYELDGDFAVKWTGFKTEKKVGVAGTFNKVNLNIQKSDNLSSFLKSAQVEIETSSLESKNPVRNTNITSTLFSLLSAKIITGKIVDVKESEKQLTLEVTMNEVKKEIQMTFENSNGKIIAKGSIEILDFALKDSFLAFAKKCGAFHQNKSFSDVNIEFTIPYK